MPMLELRYGTRLYYKDWGSGEPVVFAHGWPLNSDMWEHQMMFLASQGYRVVAHDRRGFGRSDQPWNGYDHDTFSDDLAELLDALDLTDVTLVGYAMGGGEVKVRARSGGTAVVVDVDDSGPGIGEAARQRLFDGFFTTKNTGLGGLKICRQIVEDHGGTLEHVATTGAGSVFRFTLPAAP